MNYIFQMRYCCRDVQAKGLQIYKPSELALEPGPNAGIAILAESENNHNIFLLLTLMAFNFATI